MSRFDLGNPLDFARLTTGNLNALILDFAGKDPSEWALLEGSYNGILFHVFQSKSEYQAALPRISGSGGRRKVKYSFPYVDGQTTDDLGRKPQNIECEILIYGQRYMQGYTALQFEFNDPVPGILVHPVLGRMQVAVEDVQETHSSEQRQAVLLKVTFTEHNYSIADLTETNDNSVKGALSLALDAFQRIDQAVVNVEGAINFGRSIKNQIKQALDEYKFRFGTTLSSMNVTFNKGSSADIPSLLPVNKGGTRQTDGAVTDELFLAARSVSDPFNGVPVSDLTPESATAVAVTELTKQVVGLREQLTAIIIQIDDAGGALELYDDLLSLRTTAILMQDVLEKGIASSQAQILEYMTPRIMSIREVAFANGIPVNRVQDLDILNPELESVNLIPAGTSMKVSVS